jgi:hypothetical protein
VHGTKFAQVKDTEGGLLIRMLRKYVEIRERKEQRNRVNDIMRGFIIYTFYQMSFWNLGS